MDIKLLNGIYRTKFFIGKSVKEQNPNVMLEVLQNKESCGTFGVKDTGEINYSVIDNFLSNGYVWNTIDTTSDRGRATDVSLLNPITYNNMTGSSSGTAINVLYGLNSVGIGTDGGGSVLGPAISLNLYATLLSGAGLKGTTIKKSTDGLEFTPGIGFITQDFKTLKKCMGMFFKTCDVDIERIVVDRELKKTIGEKLKGYNVTYIEDKIKFSREELIEDIRKILDMGDIFIYCENNIDFDGIGDTVLGCFGGCAREKQNFGRKKYIKILNMLDCSAVSIPLGEIGSSIVIVCKKGRENIHKVMKIADELNEEFRPGLFIDYFLNYPLKNIDNRAFKNWRSHD